MAITITENAADQILKELEELRENKQRSTESPDFIIRICEAIVAEKVGYRTREDWKHLQKIG